MLSLAHLSRSSANDWARSWLAILNRECKTSKEGEKVPEHLSFNTLIRVGWIRVTKVDGAKEI